MPIQAGVRVRQRWMQMSSGPELYKVAGVRTKHNRKKYMYTDFHESIARYLVYQNMFKSTHFLKSKFMILFMLSGQLVGVCYLQ